MTIDERIASELRRHAPKVDENSAWDRIQSEAPMARRGRATRLVPASVGALGFLLLGFILVSTFFSGQNPAANPTNPLLGTWVTTDLDGSTPTMVIQVSRGEDVEIVVHDDLASVCSGAPSTMTGTGRLDGSTELVIPSPVLTCDDESEPQAPSGPPVQEQLRNLTFVHDPDSDALTDNFGSVWERARANDPSPEPTTSGMWPQSSLEEVRVAQRLADAGDPGFTWQLEPELEMNLDDADIFARFLSEELGWEEFQFNPFSEYGAGEGTFDGLEFIRCAPGQTNTLYPSDRWGGGCAPTIDELRYETVRISAAQLDRRGPSGIWVVTRWAMIQALEQVVPPTDAEAMALLEAFLQARIDAEMAERYTGNGKIPLLYATTAGAPYERSEFELVNGPEWPGGWMEFKVRLFAEDGETVVEQFFSLASDLTGSLGLEYWSETLLPTGRAPGTTENGQALPEPYSYLNGDVTFHAAYPWHPSWAGWEFSPTMTTLLLDGKHEERLVVLADPRPIETGCEDGLAPGDAMVLAQSLWSNPALEATEPVPVRIAGIEALQMDVTAATSGNLCGEVGVPEVMAGGTATGLEPEQRMRLYLFDYPGESGRILAIAIIAPEDRFEYVLEAATPILNSFEFRMTDGD
jgi:hypothetical protein